MESAPNRGRRWDSGGTVRALAGQVPLVLWVLIALGVELRVALSLSYEPATMTSWDTVVYVDMAERELFSDASRTAGYSIFLRALHALSDALPVTIAVQHLLGIATALLLYAAFRRLRAPIAVAAAAAAGVLLSLDQVFLEHSLLSEVLFSFGFAVTLYCSVRGLEDSRTIRGALTTRSLWIGAAGVALGLCGWIRPVALPLVPLLALWCALAISGPLRARLGRAALAGAAAAAVLLAYAGLQSAENGYFGITRSSGWAFYARTAEFADCSRFEPPAGTETLCETTPPAERNGPDFYAWQPESPAVELYGYQPAGNDELAAFARAAIVNQPFDYLRTVVRDSLRYYLPSLGQRDYGGVGFEVLDIDRRAPGAEEAINVKINEYYDDQQLEVKGLWGELADLQGILRLQPWLMAVATIGVIVALVLAPARLRAGLVLIVGLGAALLFVPVATAIWNARYAVPVTGPLLGAAAAGVWLLAARVRARRRDATTA